MPRFGLFALPLKKQGGLVNIYCFNSKGFVLHYYISSQGNRKGRTIRKPMGGGGGGGGEEQKKNPPRENQMKKNSCTPINPKSIHAMA